MAKISPLEALQNAQLDARAAAMSVWIADGKVDRGSCGGAILFLKGGRKLAKVAVESGFAYSGGDIGIKNQVPDSIKSQNADIYQSAMRAFYDRLIADGYGDDIKKFWTYID